MKLTYKLILIFALSFSCSLGQPWTQLTTGTTNTINDIFFVNKNVGWFVSQYGLIRKTTDGGLSWVTQTSGNEFELKQVQFLDGNLGYILVAGGVILKTTNGGAEWVSSSLGYTGQFYGMDFISSSVGWVVGSEGKILKTTDGGSTWINQSPIINETFFGIDFIDENIGNAVGTGGKIYRSYLGGSDWFPQNSGVVSPTLLKVFLQNSSLGMIIGSGLLLRTTNGGSSWHDPIGWPSFVTDMSFLNKDSVWTASSGGTISNTTNGGQSFTPHYPLGQQNYTSIFFLDMNNGWVGGNNGILVKYAPLQQLTLTAPNGGEIWQVGTSRIITWTYTSVSNVKIEYTTNNGTNWIQITSSTPASAGSYSWTVPNTPSTNCKIRIVDTANDLISDDSDSTFIISRIFEEVISVEFPGLHHSSSAWGDYDNDGDLDVLIVGGTATNISRIYRNNGDGTFTYQTTIQLAGAASGSVDWGDFNNDGFLDIVINGFNSNGTGWFTKIYKNIAGNTFEEVAQNQIQNCHNGSTRWGDFDGDGDLDILITGGGGTEEYFTKIYRNNGNEIFSEVNSSQLTGVNYGSGEWGDYDNDGDLDILITGYSPEGIISKIYQNIDDSTFSFQPQIALPGVWNGQGVWGDFNNDSFLDFILTGATSNGQLIAKIFKNNRDNTFIEQASGVLEGVIISSIQSGDFDNDGNSDIAIIGRNSSETPITKIYLNSGDGTFYNVPTSIINVCAGSVAVADYNNDGSTDILVSGENNLVTSTKLYKNISPVVNTPPNSPVNLNSTINGRNIELSWDKSTDDHTPQAGLSYNLALGTTPGNYNSIAPMSDINSGRRRIAELGNSRINSLIIKNLLPGTYYWTVQAIDRSYLGSQFAQEQSFTIPESTGNYSLYFDGIDDFVGNMIEDKITGTTEFTVEAWIKLENPNFMALINRGPAWSYNLYHSEAYYWGIRDFEPPTYVNYSVPEINVWHHIAGTKSNDGTINLFIDGIKVASMNYVTGIIPSSTLDLQFGRYLGGGYFLKGWMTKIRISKIARYTNNFVPSLTYNLDTNTVGQWDFSTGVGSTLFDSGLNNIDGTIFGASWSTEFPLPSGAIAVTSPNGGEVWQVGTSQNITWTYTNVSNVKIEYTTNNGTNWIQISSSTPASAGSFSWTIPNTVSTNCRIKITDITNSLVTDQSNNTFTITAAPSQSVTVTSPNGGENWQVGSSHNITWTQTNVSNVKIEYSTNNGTSWIQVVAFISASTGSFSWTIPNTASTNCKVKITDVNNPLVTDESNGTFSIAQISAENYSLYFDGIDDFVGNIIENKIRDNSSFTLELWVKNQSSGNAPMITRGASSAGTLDWSYNLYALDRLYFGVNSVGYVSSPPPSMNQWHHIAAVHNADGFLWLFIDGVKVAELNQSASTLNASFSLQFGKYFADGSSDYFKGFLTRVRISKVVRYSSNFTPPISYSADTNTVGQWDFSEGSGTTLSDISLNQLHGTISGAVWSTDFPVVPSLITVTAPNGGEIWQVGSSHNITWTQSNVSNVKIEYTANNGSSWFQITPTTPASTGSYIWTVPNTASTNCKIKISDVANSAVTDQSDNNFSITIAPTITVISPDGGENWQVGSSHNITWIQTNVSNVKLEYTTNNGTTWIQVVASIPASSGSYSWIIPNTVSANCRVRVIDVNNSSVNDQSNSTFTISAEPSQSITVTAPNGGENWPVGSSQNIRWTQSGITNLKIEYSTNDGSSWTQIVASTPAAAGSYPWTIPNTLSSSCRVRISDAANSSVSDQSNAVFTISVAPVFSVQVTSPNGGERWFAETQYSITWNSTNVEDLKLEYTSDGGSSWIQIAGSVAANLGSYIWTIPNTPSANCKVRLTSVANPGVSDESEAVFTIAEAPKVILTSPNGGETWMVGHQYSITWTAASVNKLRGEYSTDGGTQWILISDTISANLGSYIWTIPNTESGNCLVRLSGIDQTSASDLSNAPFTIELERNLALTAPVPGETYTSGRNMAIRWNYLNVEMVDIQYSPDNGASWQTVSDSLNAASQLYEWIIPESNSSQARIRIVHTTKPLIKSELSGTITLLPSPKVTLQSVLSGAFLKAGDSYRIEWFVENVSSVDLHFSSDGGNTWNTIASNLPATVRSHEWTVPSVNSNSCKVKVVSVDDPGLFSETQNSFTIYTYSQTVSLFHSWQFGDIKDISNYRLISIPGYISENLGDLMPGKHVNDWNAYWDNGDDSNYQIQFDGGSRFVIQPGKGFWVLSKDPVTMTRQSAAVTIDSTLKFAIPLHNGWNIIGNVFTKPLDWAGIRSANSLPQNSLLYFWDGSWTFPAQMEPYKGYYFFNGDNRQSLNLVYPVTAGLAKTNNGTQFPAVKGSVAISFAGNEIVAGLDEESATGLDTNDFMLPGISFSERSVAFLSHSQDGKLRQLFIESQPCDSIGNSFKIEVKNNSTEITKLRFRSVLEQERVNVYLLDEKYNEFIDLRTKSEFDIVPQRDNRYFTLLIGDNAFINSMKAKYLPGEYELYQNYPNPFNPETSIKYALPKDGSVKIRLYDILGNEIMTLFDGEETAGVHSRSFDLSGLASGVYLYRLEAGDKSLVKKLVLLK